MRIVIDLQGAQGGSSRFRGIGRYGLSLTQWMAHNRGAHEVFVALNGEFAESNEPLRAALMDYLPPENIIVWDAPAPNFGADTNNAERRKAAELIRESALARLDPDYVLISSVFEGWGENVVTSVGRLSSTVPTAIILYDLIPLIHRDIYLRDATLASWYENKLSYLREADLLLAISESSRQESIDYLGIDPRNTVNISTAAEEHFTPATIDAKTRSHLAHAYGIERPFVMYTGGIDFRKNIEGLIEAYSRIAKAVRRQHQLAIVCAVQEPERLRLLAFAAGLGLAEGELIMTGFIPEDDLIACYRSCKLFVFPSWHEGFGLPVLEAMKCGRAVIASDRSSLPEVVGLESALFDPFDLDALSDKIADLLTNDKERTKLERHSLIQAKKFDWNQTSRRAWAAMEESHARQQQKRALPLAPPVRKPRLAFLSPLPPEASGIADYSAELLPELARHYQIDVVVTQSHISDVSITANYPVRSVEWFREHASEFDRILYHFGNSEFHMHMFDLLRAYPGVVVLHDFYLSGISYYREAVQDNPQGFARDLLHAHGWLAATQRFKAKDIEDVVWAYPCNLQVIQESLGIIVHSDYSRNLACQWYGDDAADDWKLIPLLRQPLLGLDRGAARAALNLRPDDFVVCSFGMLAKSKMNDRLVAAWLASPLAKDPRCHLVFVGQNDGGDYGAGMQHKIGKAFSDRIKITGWADMATFRQWLAAADVGVQLRTLSRGETSAAVLDCMNAGLATIVNANGSMGELPPDSVWLMNDAFADEDLVEALTVLWEDDDRRNDLSEAARNHIRLRHQPRRCGNEYALAIEHYYAKAITRESGLEHALVKSGINLSSPEWAAAGRSIARSLPVNPRPKRLLVDITVLVQHDARSGIQRVVRSILSHWLSNPPVGWSVEPVYADASRQGFRYARRFTCRYMNIWDAWCEDEMVEPAPGDVFVGLDLSPTSTTQQHGLLQAWRRYGVKVHFVVYDLLPVVLGDLFTTDDRQNFSAWLNAVTQFDSVICISRSVADTCHDWLVHYGAKRELPLAINWFHLGADTENSIPTTGLPSDAEAVLSTLRSSPSFLTVGTIEPRKGARQVLAAFEKLWAKNVPANLVLVGKLGWMMDDLADQLRNHPELNRKLFWLEAISDEYLDRVYAACSSLIAASEGEGFGLPLIEAARHGLPVIARDIPVFREVAGEAATYFEDSRDPQAIATVVEQAINGRNKAANPPTISWLTWAESAQALLKIVMGQEKPYKNWLPDGVLRLWGSDSRMLSAVGVPDRKKMRTNGQAGFLLYGPYLPMAGQSYRMTASGDAAKLVGTEMIDVTSHGGSNIYWRGSPQRVKGAWSIDQVITFDGPIKDLEIRFWVDQGTDMSVEGITLEPCGDVDQTTASSKKVKVDA
ncbi:MAG: group 1 glycosyl transferase [Rhizobium sp.]|nr:MAG: group 1 glycosyl transferase [Rhizobium sp.]